MARYIDAERYKKKLLNWVKDCDREDTEQVHVGQVIEDCAYSIDDEPSADVAPVIHAHWENIGNGHAECSNCGMTVSADYPASPCVHYCAKCGAKMDEK